MTNEPTESESQDPLRRYPQDGIVAGVAAGLGRRFGVSPWWFRAGFVLLTPLGGLGIALYVLGWLLIPEVGKTVSLAGSWVGGAGERDVSTWIGIGLLALAGLIILGWIGLLDSAVFWAGLLLLIGIMLYRGDLRVGSGDTPPPSAPDPPRDGETFEVTEGPIDEDETLGGGGDEPPPLAQQVVEDDGSEPAARAPRSLTGLATLGVTLLVIGGMALASSASWIEPSFADYVAATVGVIGAGLIAGAFWGRSVALIVVGVLLLPVLLFARYIPIGLDGEFGDARYAPKTIDDLQAEYSQPAGELRLDLRGLDLEGRTVETTIDVGAGAVRVDLPPDAGFQVDASLGIGELEVLNRQDFGVAMTMRANRPGNGKIVLEINLGVGSARVEQPGAAAIDPSELQQSNESGAQFPFRYEEGRVT